MSASAAAPAQATPALTAWLARAVPRLAPPLSVERIAGGRSNLTLRVRDAGGASVVVRRGPESSQVASAHDMGREHRILRGVHGTPVPVPVPLGFCAEEDVLGAPFHAMEDVAGIVVRDAASAAALSEPARARASRELVDALARLHALDLERVGLDALAPRRGYLQRQLRRWPAQWESGEPLRPRVVALAEALAQHCPDVPSCLVHGDYRLDNAVVSAEGELLAVLDWELATLGDPLADLALLLVYWVEPGDDLRPLGEAPTALPGFASRAELAERYAEVSGRALAGLDWYVAFADWKLACVLHGVWARAREGAYGEGFTETDELPGRVEALLERAADTLDGAPIGSYAPPPANPR
jgi:aminoglycoside phosphotransferase (APT) family kinase protein